jgi:allantoicase
MPGRRDGGIVGGRGEGSVEVATTYEFQVDGWLTERAREAFCDMTIEELPEGALMYGDVTDESHLLGIIAQFRSLGLVVVSAHRVVAGPPSTFP